MAQWGGITLGDYRESFLSPLEPWAALAYEQAWLEAAQRLVDGADRSGFFTQAYLMWWVLYREGERVFVHEQVLAERDDTGPMSPGTPHHLIADRRTLTDEGQAISEWEVSMEDVREFVRRARRRSGNAGFAATLAHD